MCCGITPYLVNDLKNHPSGPLNTSVIENIIVGNKISTVPNLGERVSSFGDFSLRIRILFITSYCWPEFPPTSLLLVSLITAVPPSLGRRSVTGRSPLGRRPCVVKGEMGHAQQPMDLDEFDQLGNSVEVVMKRFDTDSQLVLRLTPTLI